MTIVELLIIAAILLYTGWPLFRPETASITADEEGDDLHKLLYRKDTSLMAIKELEFDYKTGKIDEDDYRELKKSFESNAVGILKAIDDLKKGGKTVKPKDKTATCSKCGNSLKSSDLFCPQCGQKA